MRFWALFFLEVAAFGGTTLALTLGARAYHLRMGSSAAVSTLAPAQGGPLWPERTLPLSSSAAGTFLGMSDEMLLERMRQSEVKTLKFNRGGSSVSFRVDFQDGSRACFKPTQINPQSVPRKEVAAYRISRLLGLNLIPPATLRSLSREDLLGKLLPESASMRPRVEAETIFDNGVTSGVLSYWIPSIMNMGLDSSEGVSRWSEWLTIGHRIPDDKIHLMAQLSTLLLFDLLQNNSDRFSGGNLVGSPDGKTLFFMDNAFGFQVDPEGHPRCRSYLARAQKFSRSFVERLRRLSKVSIERALAEEPGPPVLQEAEIEALLGRRDVALRYVDRLIQEHGEEQVLVFP